MNYRNWTVADLLDMVGSGVNHGPAGLLQSEGEKGGQWRGALTLAQWRCRRGVQETMSDLL